MLLLTRTKYSKTNRFKRFTWRDRYESPPTATPNGINFIQSPTPRLNHPEETVWFYS